MEQPEEQPGKGGTGNADKGRAGMIGHGVTCHRTDDERPFQPEVDAPGPLGQALTERDKQEGRGDADRAAKNGEGNTPHTQC